MEGKRGGARVSHLPQRLGDESQVGVRRGAIVTELQAGGTAVEQATVGWRRGREEWIVVSGREVDRGEGPRQDLRNLVGDVGISCCVVVGLHLLLMILYEDALGDAAAGFSIPFGGGNRIGQRPQTPHPNL